MNEGSIAGRAAGIKLLMTVAAFICFAFSASGTEEGGTLRIPFHAVVAVEVDGHATADAVDGVKGALAEVIREELAATKYVPARREGVPVASTSPAVGMAVLTPIEGGDYDVRIEHVSLEPRLLRSVPPLYPSTQLRAGSRPGTVELVLRIGVDGRITDIRPISSTHPDFETAVRRALKRWRFDEVGSQPTEVVLPVWFHSDSTSSAEPPAFECALARERAYVEGQDGCLDLFEIISR